MSADFSSVRHRVSRKFTINIYFSPLKNYAGYTKPFPQQYKTLIIQYINKLNIKITLNLN